MTSVNLTKFRATMQNYLGDVYDCMDKGTTIVEGDITVSFNDAVVTIPMNADTYNALADFIDEAIKDELYTKS